MAACPARVDGDAGWIRGYAAERGAQPISLRDAIARSRSASALMSIVPALGRAVLQQDQAGSSRCDGLRQACGERPRVRALSRSL